MTDTINIIAFLEVVPVSLFFAVMAVNEYMKLTASKLNKDYRKLAVYIVFAFSPILLPALLTQLGQLESFRFLTTFEPKGRRYLSSGVFTLLGLLLNVLPLLALVKWETNRTLLFYILVLIAGSVVMLFSGGFIILGVIWSILGMVDLSGIT